MINAALKAGEYVGFFIVSLVSNAIPYSTIPYLFWLAPFFARIRDPWSLMLAVASSALGASIGKLLVYMLGRGLSTFGRESRFKQNIAYLTSRHSTATFIMVFMAAALPIPDDVVYIPVGYARYNILLFFTALTAGKLVVTSMAAVYGRAFSFLFEEHPGIPSWVTVAAYIAITLLAMYIAGSIDWINMSNVFREKGFRQGVRVLLSELYATLRRLPGYVSRLANRN